jgi:hypothetical protein
LSPCLDQCLAELPDLDHRLLIEHFLDGRTQASLARDQGVSPATMSRRIQAALARLRERLENRGVAAPTVLLAALLADHAAQAPPATLLQTLGKMAMVSTSPGKATVAIGSFSGFTGVTALLVVLGILTLGTGMAMLLTDDDQPHPSTAEKTSPPPPPAAGADAEVQPSALVHIPGTADKLDGETVVAFQYTPDGRRIHVGFADAHVVVMPVDRARALIEQQTGKTLEQLTRESP